MSCLKLYGKDLFLPDVQLNKEDAMRLNIFITILCIAFAAITGCNQRNDYAYEDWDADDNNLIDNNEFNTSWNQFGFYNGWDVNSDNFLDEEEWERGIDENYINYNYDENGNYEDWDLDNDGTLNEQEFSEGSYSLWDTNNDGNIQADEFQEWHYGID